MILSLVSVRAHVRATVGATKAEYMGRAAAFLGHGSTENRSASKCKIGYS